jgi:S-methylmethionine-dependent homocysteine/selenocysteine methylase
MAYTKLENRLKEGGVVILDGGTGTELERQGVPMDPEAWCGAAALENVSVLEEIHRDYIAAGADVITANTYASSRLILEEAGLADRFEEINRAAVGAALKARDTSGQEDVLVAGSISHRGAIRIGSAAPELSRKPSRAALIDALGELADLLKAAGCDLIILEMMYDPEKMNAAFSAAASTGLPVWAGFSVRRGVDGSILAFAPDRDIPFEDLLSVLEDYPVAAAGIMHSQANVTADALAILHRAFDGPLLAYPDSGYFKSPHWVFDEVMPPDALRRFAQEWFDQGLQIVGGCCGLTPAHIEALRGFKQ